MKGLILKLFIANITLLSNGTEKTTYQDGFGFDKEKKIENTIMVNAGKKIIIGNKVINTKDVYFNNGKVIFRVKNKLYNYSLNQQKLPQPILYLINKFKA